MQSPFLEYVRNGWVLAPLKPGEKRPNQRGWNEQDLCLSTEADVADVVAAGLAHAYSGTCCVDIDDVEQATRWLDARGIDLAAVLSDPQAVQITSGRPNRAKLLYAMPTPLMSVKIVEAKANIIDFRCASRSGLSAQDALPPTIHPDTKKPYRWLFNDLVTHWSTPPKMPKVLQDIWYGLIEERNADKEPVDIDTDEETLEHLLLAMDPDSDYNQWVNVGMALHHATGGSDEGLALWDRWSAQSGKYRGLKDLEPHWRSFRGSGVTVDYLLMHQVSSPDDFDEVTDEQVEEVTGEKPARFRPERIGEWVTRPPPEWIVRNVLPQSELAMMYGDSGSGKSAFALDIAMCIAGKTSWWGRDTKHGPVLWVAAEAAGSVRNRALAYAAHHGVSLQGTELWIVGDTPDLNKVDDVRQLLKGMKPLKPKVVVVDTLNAASGGANENSGEDMAVVLAACKTLHRITGALVLLIHHSGKDKSRGARGWSGLKASMQTMFDVSHDPDSGERNVRIDKQRDGEEGVDFPFHLKSINLPAYDGVPQVSIIVEPLTGVTAFRPSLHPGWHSLMVSGFLSAADEDLDTDSKLLPWLFERASALGTESELIDDCIQEVTRQMSDSGWLSIGNTTTTLLPNGFEED